MQYLNDIVLLKPWYQ